MMMRGQVVKRETDQWKPVHVMVDWFGPQHRNRSHSHRCFTETFFVSRQIMIEWGLKISKALLTSSKIPNTEYINYIPFNKGFPSLQNATILTYFHSTWIYEMDQTGKECYQCQVQAKNPVPRSNGRILWPISVDNCTPADAAGAQNQTECSTGDGSVWCVFYILLHSSRLVCTQSTVSTFYGTRLVLCTYCVYLL